MNRSILWKIGVGLFVLALVCGLAGGLLGFRLARAQWEQRNNPDHWNEEAMRTFDRTVNPTPEQRQVIGAYLDAAVEELKNIRADTIARSTNVIWRLVDQVERELTPEQREAFDKMKPKQEELRNLDLLDVGSQKN
ncbi:MAG TPA: hypothetical protein P5186_15325 [Candidatus Paceibacterota bacterium]|nr:hypothetical protein [Verrucomicrobiota bacterium]HRY49420.1 hypothetical protein [Candidatus Paceibacterota bacterium]HSA03517.1 hypothetical protein [Candidatus Paceibacterota bacterium]